MEEKPKSKISSDSLVGLAAVIASIAIPLAQFLVGYFENRTAQMQNISLEQERRRLEITKLFMDNYVGKSAEVQVATVQIMKTLDPNFFISIEGGLKNATKNDTVRASIIKATVEAATELGEAPLPQTNKKKVQKVLTAKDFEEQGYKWISSGDFDKAQQSFQKSHQEFPTYKSVDDFYEKYDKDFSSNLNPEQKKKFRLFKKKDSFSAVDTLKFK